MHHPMLPFQSPKHSHHRSLTPIKSSQSPIYHMTMKQVSSFQQYYDDVKYQLAFIDKFIVIGHVKQLSKGLSQRNIPLLKFKITDGTRQWRDQKQFITYDTKMEEKLMYALKNKLYLQIGCQIKVTGLVYKTEIQVTAVSFKLVNDFNTVTEHFLACMKANLITV